MWFESARHIGTPAEAVNRSIPTLVCTAGAVALQVSWSRCVMTGWAMALTKTCEETPLTHVYVEKRLGDTLADIWRDSHGLGGEKDGLKDIKEGSGFPHASALFLGYWNVLQEQHKLSNGFTTRHCASWPKVFLMRSGMLVLFPATEASASSEMY